VKFKIGDEVEDSGGDRGVVITPEEMMQIRREEEPDFDEDVIDPGIDFITNPICIHFHNPDPETWSAHPVPATSVTMIRPAKIAKIVGNELILEEP